MTLLFSYPLVFNKLRFSVHSLLFPGRDVDFRAVVAYALVLNPLVFAVGAYVTDLSVVLSFNVGSSKPDHRPEALPEICGRWAWLRHYPPLC